MNNNEKMKGPKQHLLKDKKKKLRKEGYETLIIGNGQRKSMTKNIAKK
jgi:lysylphosphatidylglycerol synthetase-like protein (DUF2156 family)